MRTVNDAGRNLIKSFEQLRLVGYRDLRGIPTIGYGHTGSEVHVGDRITEFEADGLLEQDLAAAERLVSCCVSAPLNENQFSALVSAAFNIGPKLFHNADGTHTHILAALNAGDFQAAADQLLRWDHAAGVEVAGLLRRREAERALFLAAPPESSS